MPFKLPVWKWVVITSGLILVLFSIFLPVWEGFDEPAHFCYVQHLVEHKKIPNPPGEGQTDYCSAEVEDSFAQLPLNKSLSLSPQLIGSGFLSYDEYWKIKLDTAPEKINDSQEARTSTNNLLDIWQAQHPPLPYLVLTIPYVATLPLGFYVQILVLRLVCVAITLLGVWVCWKALERLPVNSATKLFGLVAVTLAPMFFIHFGRISNEPVTFLLFSVTWYFLLGLLTKQPLKNWQLLACGLVYGLGFVSKIFFATALPAVFVVFAFNFFSQGMRQEWLARLKHYAMVLLGIAILAVPWFLYQRFGPVTAGVGFASQSLGLNTLWSSVVDMDWIGFGRELFLNYSGLFGWSFLRTSPWFYKVQILFWLVTVIGFVRLRGEHLKIATSAVLFPLTLTAGMAYYNLQFHALTITGSWYFYSLGAMMATLIGLSWGRLFKERWLHVLALLLASGSSLYVLWIVFKLMMPVYYAV